MDFKIKIHLSILFFLILIIPVTSSALIIKGLVFEDKNCNGNKNLGEKGIAGVSVVLTPGPVFAVTNAKGRFTFSGITPGTYILTETDPFGYCSTSPNVRIVRLVFKNVSGQLYADSKKAISPPAGCCSP